MIHSLIFFILSVLYIFEFGQDNYRRLREDMVKYQIEARNVRHKATLEAMRTVPRHEFMPSQKQRFDHLATLYRSIYDIYYRS
jgi:protein-L-isoaspartate(D-aspartate) O-methyltransferase